MDVGTTLVLLFALTLALVTALPGNDHEGDVGVCGNTCKVNEFCDEPQGICLDCSLCFTSVYCASQDCQGNHDMMSFHLVNLYIIIVHLLTI